MARTELEQLVFSMSADIRKLEKSNARAIANVDKTARGIQGRYDKASGGVGKAIDKAINNSRMGLINAGASRLGVLGGALEAVGPAGLVAAAGVVALGVALTQARAAMDFADEIADSAAQAQVGVQALQEYRFAAVAAGGGTKDADEALKGLSGTMGRAIAGEAKALKWFKALDIDREQLMRLGSAEALLPIIADKIAGLATEAEKAALADKLGVRPLLPLLEQGSAGLARMTAKAAELGVVMDTQTVTALAEAHDQVEALGFVTKTNLMQAFASLAPVIVYITGLVARFSQFVSESIDNFRRLEDRASVNLRARDRDLASAQLDIIQTQGDPSQYRGALKREWDKVNEERGSIYAILRDQQAADAAAVPKPSGDNHLNVAVPGGGRSSAPAGPSLADVQRQEAERQQRVAEDLYRAKLAEFDAQVGINRNLDDRQKFERDRFEMERSHELGALEADRIDAKAAIDRQLAGKNVSAAVRAQLVAAKAQIDADYDRLRATVESKNSAEKRNMLEQQALDRQKQEIDQLAEMARLHAQVLQAQSAGARTWQERRRIEEELLKLQLAEQRAALERRMEEEHWDEARRARARAEQKTYEALADQELQRSTAGPLERYGEDIEFTTDKLEELAVDGLGQLSDAVTGLITGTKTAAEALKEVWASMLQSIIKMVVDQVVAKPAADILGQILGAVFAGMPGMGGPGGSTGGGSGGGAPGFAKGGRPPMGRVSMVGEHGPEPFVPDVPGTILSNPTLRAIQALNPGSLGGGGTSISVPFALTINAPGADAAALGHLVAEVKKLKADLPLIVKVNCQEGLDRGQIRNRRVR